MICNINNSVSLVINCKSWTKEKFHSQIRIHDDVFSEVQPVQSASLESVVESFRQNAVGLKGIITTPSQFKGGVLQTLNMKLRYDHHHAQSVQGRGAADA